MDKLGQKLQGVENIVGHHVAVSEMAEMLGIHIHQVHVPCQRLRFLSWRVESPLLISSFLAMMSASKL